MYEKSRFKNHIRIDPKQLIWIRKIKDTKTLAGYLDKMINHYKKCPNALGIKKDKK